MEINSSPCGSGRRRILVFADWYRPAHRAGGQVTALSNLIACIGDEFEFYILTSDRDQGSSAPYSEVPRDCWTVYGKSRVYYTANLSARSILRRIGETQPHILYVNSFFSPLTTRVLLLRRLGLLSRYPVVLAPRGELSPGALRLKAVRKWLFRKVSAGLGLHRGLIWHASSTLEQQQIEGCITPAARDRVRVANEVPDPNSFASNTTDRVSKNSGSVRFLFVGGILPMKNLRRSIELLHSLQGEVRFTIAGPPHDAGYWEECQARIGALPPSVAVDYRGPAPYDTVSGLFRQHHFLLLPTLGENFGYVILEALAAGCPAIISDLTPWRRLQEHGAGWDLPLSDEESWRRILQQCVDMGPEEYLRLSQQAYAYARTWSESTPIREQARNLFETACSGAGQRARDAGKVAGVRY